MPDKPTVFESSAAPMPQLGRKRPAGGVRSTRKQPGDVGNGGAEQCAPAAPGFDNAREVVMRLIDVLKEQ
jgi:hypothetical protein